jgi:hypothetical protein
MKTIAMSNKIGEIFGHIIVLGDPLVPRIGYCLAQCICGEKRDFAYRRIKKLATGSCGCKRKSPANKTHGLCKTNAYKCWKGMKTRCNNKNGAWWKNYGGRGIAYCARWERFELFLEDMGHPPEGKPTLDRIDSNANYCKENCRWADYKTQSRNKRNTRIVIVRGEAKSMSEWSEISGINYDCLQKRLDKGWSGEDAVSKPKRILKRRKKNVLVEVHE